MILSAWVLGQASQSHLIPSGVIPSGPVNEFKLTNGDVVRGDLNSPNEEGFVVKLKVGGFSERIPWARVSQETLKKLVNKPDLSQLVGPFIEIPIEVKMAMIPKKKEFHPKPVTRVELPPKEAGFMSAASMPFNLALLGLIYAANVYAGFSIGVFRNRPGMMTGAVSAVLPVLGPLLFLALPERVNDASSSSSVDAAGVQPTGGSHMATGAPSTQSTLNMAKGHEKAAANPLEPAVYNRGETTFNRRFFETKFPGFFRVVPSDAEKDMVVVIKTAKAELIAKRIARISSTEIHLQLAQTGGKETSVTFTEISQVQLRHKDSRV